MRPPDDEEFASKGIRADILLKLVLNTTKRFAVSIIYRDWTPRAERELFREDDGIYILLPKTIT